VSVASKQWVHLGWPSALRLWNSWVLAAPLVMAVVKAAKKALVAAAKKAVLLVPARPFAPER